MLFFLIINTASAEILGKDDVKPFNLSDVNYETIGEGTPVLMLHGMKVDHHVMKNSFEPVFERLPQKWKRIYLDLPGMGKTKAYDWICNSDDMLAFVIRFIEKVIPGEDFIVAGYSYGGYLARGLLTEKKESVKGTLFICPLVIADDAKRNVSHESFYRKEPLTDCEPDLATASLIDYFLVNQNCSTVKRFKADIVSGHQAADQDFTSKIRDNPDNYSFSHKIINRFSGFTGKSCFITAKQDMLVGYHDARNFSSSFTDNIFAVIDSAGHAVQIDKQNKFEFYVKKFFESLDSEKSKKEK